MNAEIDGTDIVYKNYYHIGVAVGTEKGLVVPVARRPTWPTIAEIRGKIGEFGRRARDGKLGIDDMQGGTFTISNGGVYARSCRRRSSTRRSRASSACTAPRSARSCTTGRSWCGR